MRIAMTHVDLPNESRGGVAHQVHYLANTLVERGHEVTVFTFSPGYEDCHYRVHQFSRPPGSRRLYPYILAVRLARTDFARFDVLHANGDNFLLWGRHPQVRTFYGSARAEARSAVTLQRRVHQWFAAWLEKIGAHVADISVGISEATRDQIPSVSVVVPCGVDIVRFHPGPKSRKPAILFVGTAGGRKRGRFLADVFVREVRPHFPDAELWAVTDLPLQGPGIVNFGRVALETLAGLYQRAWVFCLPSTYEGFGVPYIEAMAAGTAIIASRNPGAREVLGQGAFGILAEDTRLGEKICRLLSDESVRAAYVTKGLIRVREYAWDHVARRYEAIYRELMSTQVRLPPARARLGRLS